MRGREKTRISRGCDPLCRNNVHTRCFGGARVSLNRNGYSYESSNRAGSWRLINALDTLDNLNLQFRQRSDVPPKLHPLRHIRENARQASIDYPLRSSYGDRSTRQIARDTLLRYHAE